MDIKKIHKKGYVRLVNHMGDDLTPVNAARVSYNKESKAFNDRDKKLLNFLIHSNPPHTSPFRHAMMQFEVYAPLMVARQWWKYIVGSDHRDPMTAWNESSRRYVTEVPEFYIPREGEWRSAPENSKQGSGEPISIAKGQFFTAALNQYCEQGEALYESAMKEGICAEQARLFLPAYGLYVRWYWTASLEGVIHFLHQRLGHDAQKEIQEFAEAVAEFTQEKFPVTYGEIFDGSESR